MQLARKRNFESTPAIPDRLYFKIGDVARICGVETYVLRFWESQFPQLKPNKGGTGQRLYRRRDVETALEIKRLVHAQGYTLAGARQALDQAGRRSTPNQLEPQAVEPRAVEPSLVLQASAPREAQPEPQSRLPLLAANPILRLDTVAAAIGHARAELREIAGLLASPVRLQARRRPRMTALSNTSGSLFQS
jgi:DNA-binding transcriptional MerR regulator